MKVLLLTVLIIFSLVCIGNATALGDLVSQMQPKSWAELQTNNLDQDYLGYGSLVHTVYADGAVWDPSTEQFLYLGSYHAWAPEHLSYQASTNTWRKVSTPFSYITYHSYDHNTIDQARGISYFREAHSGKGMYKYDVAGDNWTKIGEHNLSTCCGGMAYFPELDKIIYYDGQASGGTLKLYDPNTNTWQNLGAGYGCSTYHSFAEYSPIHKVVIFGGGNGCNKFYKIDVNKTITPLKNAPVNLGVAWGTICTVDPVTGDYLFATSGGQFYAYDVTTDTWDLQSGSAPIFDPPLITSDSKIQGIVAAPISTYGVLMYLVPHYGQDPTVHISKHAEMISTQRKSLLNRKIADLELYVTPNPFNSAVKIMVRCYAYGVQRVSLQIYDISGKPVKDYTPYASRITPYTFAWNASRLPNGLYLVKVSMGTKTATKKIFLSK
jgi:hypothetical protein